VRIINETIDEHGDCEVTIELDRKHLGLLKDIKMEEVV
jgi:GTP-binding protein HflX